MGVNKPLRLWNERFRPSAVQAVSTGSLGRQGYRQRLCDFCVAESESDN